MHRLMTRLLVTGLLLLVANQTVAQPPNWFPGSGRNMDPQKMFQQFMGGGEFTPEELERIQRVKISKQDEQNYGAESIKQLRRDLKKLGNKVVARGEQVGYLRSLVNQLHPLMQNARRYQRIEVYVVESPEVMAWAYPGGTIFVYQGMVEFAETEAALVGVLGHELSHIDRGHQLFDLKRNRLFQESFGAGKQFSFENMMRNQQFMMKSMMRPFRPEEESVADADGVRWAFELGYDPREMAKLMLRMQQKQQRQNPNQQMISQWTQFLRSHPATEVRYNAISEAAQRFLVTATNPPYRGRRNLAQGIPRQKREFPDEFARQ